MYQAGTSEPPSIGGIGPPPTSVVEPPPFSAKGASSSGTRPTYHEPNQEPHSCTLFGHPCFSPVQTYDSFISYFTQETKRLTIVSFEIIFPYYTHI